MGGWGSPHGREVVVGSDQSDASSGVDDTVCVLLVMSLAGRRCGYYKIADSLDYARVPMGVVGGARRYRWCVV